MNSYRLCLPGGLCLDNKQLYQNVQLRPITGKDEEIVYDIYNVERNASKIISFLIRRCIESIGPVTHINENTIQQLLVADRDYLALKLRQITFGNKVKSTIICQNQSCAKKMDIDFNIEDIPIIRRDLTNGIIFHRLSEKGSYCISNERYREVEFRLPNIGDLEYISNIALENKEKAANILLSRCITRLGNVIEITEGLVLSLPIVTLNEIEEAMMNYSPKVELEMDIQCPECESIFTTMWDVYHFL